MRKLAAVTAALLIGVSACSDEVVGPDLDATETQELVLAAADAAALDLEVVNGNGIPGSSAGNLLFPLMIGGHPDCPRDDNGRYRCERMREGATEFTRTVTFYDGEGEIQAEYHPLDTDSINFVINLIHDMDRPHFTGTVEQDRDMTLSGLLGTEETGTWNGTGTSTIDRAGDTPGMGPYQLHAEGSSTVTDVVVPHPRDDWAWPLSGTILKEWTVTITRLGVTTTKECTILVAFNGSATVTVTIDGETFTVDLEEHRRRKGGHS